MVKPSSAACLSRAAQVTRRSTAWLFRYMVSPVVLFMVMDFREEVELMPFCSIRLRR